jgi:ATP-dependent Lon protease
LKSNDGWSLHERIVVPSRTWEKLDRDRRERKLAELDEEFRRDVEAEPTGNTSVESKFVSVDAWSDPLTGYSGPKWRIFDRIAVEQNLAISSGQYRDSASKSRQKELLALLKRKGEYRKLAQIPPNWLEVLGDLEAAFPNFASVVDYLRALFSLAALEDGVPRLDPMVLAGPPGIGKSLFAENLANICGGTFLRINMENLQTNSSLAGSEEYWGNTRYGMVFESLVEGDFANPVMFLDELDKVQADGRYDPLSPLYMLLEAGTAASFRDLSIPRIVLDASRIIWIMTANDIQPVPRPIVDRVKVFNVPRFSEAEAKQIAQQVFDELRMNLRIEPPFAPLGDEVLTLLIGISARRQRQMLREACGRALLESRRDLRVEDIRLSSHDGERRKIGFL